MNNWNERPQDVSGEELIAWALCQIADSVDSLGLEIRAHADTLLKGDAPASVGGLSALVLTLADGLEEFNSAVDQIAKVAYATKALGLNDAGTQMGAVEVLSQEIREGFNLIAVALENHE